MDFESLLILRSTDIQHLPDGHIQATKGVSLVCRVRRLEGSDLLREDMYFDPPPPTKGRSPGRLGGQSEKLQSENDPRKKLAGLQIHRLCPALTAD